MIGPLYLIDSLRQSTRLFAWLTFGVSILGGIAVVQAQVVSPPALLTVPVQFEYVAPSECADQSLFADRVRGRSERIQFDPLAKKQLAVTIQGHGSIWKGRVSFIETDQEPLSREISARSCDEVIDGLALVTVMVLDPDAIQHVSTDVRPPSIPVASSSASSAPSTSPEPKPKPRVQSPRELPTHIEVGADATLAGTAGPAPGVMWGWGASAQFSWVRPSPWSPHIRISGLHFSRDAYLARGGTANFRLNDVLLSLCPYSVRYGSLRFRPCVAGSYGQLSAGGARTFVPLTETLTWAEADVQVEVTWNPTGHLELFLAPTSGLALKRYSFGFEPYVFHNVPPVIVSGVAGLGLQFE